MKKSNVFRAMESVLTEIEDSITYAQDRLKEANERLSELKNIEGVDNWKITDAENRVETKEIELALYEEAYNYIYLNFNKLPLLKK